LIQAGSDWRTAITRALDEAKVAILVITADFIASGFIRENEFLEYLKNAQIGGAVILPLIVDPSRFNLMESLSRFHGKNIL
jgi:TIR domain